MSHPGSNTTDAKLRDHAPTHLNRVLATCDLFHRQWRNGIRDDRLLVTVHQVERHILNHLSESLPMPTSNDEHMSKAEGHLRRAQLFFMVAALFNFMALVMWVLWFLAG